MSKNLSKLQIETAEEVLRTALRNKRKEIASEAFNKDIVKYKAQVLAFHKKAYALRQEALKFKEEVEKNPKLEVSMDSYSSMVSKLPTSLENPSQSLKIESKNTGDYGRDELKGYYPDTKKQEEDIDNFVLGLKLGTVLMSELQTFLDEIKKIK